METTLLIYANNSEQEKIPALKNEIVDYLGLRLVSSEMVGFPSIGIYGTLNPEDKKAISLMVEKTNSPTLSILFIEHSNSFLNQTVTTIVYDK